MTNFSFQPEYKYLESEFNKYRLKSGTNKEKWHQIVRFALSDEKQHRYMYDRLLHLLLRHRNNFGDYFKLKTENGTTLFPDRVSEINILLSIYREFFAIFKTIIKRIHFDYPTENILGNIIRSKINWEGTMKNNYTNYPLKFQLIKWHKEFVTPENIFLILCAVWLNKICKNLLNISFVEPLNFNELNILNYVINKTNSIVNFFPFQDVKASARKFSSLPFNDKRILDLEKMFELRLARGILQITSYYNLLQWCRKFRQMNIRLVSSKRTNFPLETLENLDTVYEAWIFFEFVDFFSRHEILYKLEINEEPNFFDIKYEGHLIRFYYDKKFKRGDGCAWAIDSRPDFTVMKEDQIIAIFDAKNYNTSSQLKGEAKHKILAYLTNLDCGFGGLFFPNFEFEEYTYPEAGRVARHHNKLRVGYYNMRPSSSVDAIRSKNETLSKIFHEIINRIALSIITG